MRLWSAAAREAMLNAAKFAGEAPVSVYAELSEERIQVFVRDRGAGFDPAAVPQARRGVRESIVGRMRRAGGRRGGALAAGWGHRGRDHASIAESDRERRDRRRGS